MNKKSAFEDALDKSLERSKQVTSLLGAVKDSVNGPNREYLYHLIMQAVEKSEKLTLGIRNLPAFTGHPRAQEHTQQAIRDNIKVQIGYTEQGWFSVQIPMLLPKKETGSASYIRAILYPAMKRFFLVRKPVRHQECILIYRHVYDERRPERAYRDHDNIETNMVTDIVALYVMEDDAARKCVHYYCSAAGDSDRTEVYVVPVSQFMQWLAMEKTFPKSGLHLLKDPKSAS